MSDRSSLSFPKQAHCQICGTQCDLDDLVLGQTIRSGIADLIAEQHPKWDEHAFICYPDLNRFRNIYTRRLMEQDRGEMTDLEQEVLESLSENELLSSNLNTAFEEKLTFGEALSDRIARFGGSWFFILTFFAILCGWILINTVILPTKDRFDEYPFILLNLVLSCIAALQAPIIMMSQNRQEAKDRLRSEQDYKVNLKAELEIRHLTSKLDQLRQHQWRRLLEIQHIQMDLIAELAGKSAKSFKSTGSDISSTPSA